MSRGKRQLLIALVFLGFVTFLLTSFRIAVVHGDSMLPTYTNGQRVFVTRWGAGSLKRGDVVLVAHGNDVLIKRVERLAGETLSMAEAVDYDDDILNEFFEKTSDPRNPVRVPPGQLVVLGDNPAVSDDSRRFGPVLSKEVLGRVINAPPKQ